MPQSYGWYWQNLLYSHCAKYLLGSVCNPNSLQTSNVQFRVSLPFFHWNERQQQGDGGRVTSPLWRNMHIQLSPAAFHNPTAMYFLKATDGNFYGCYRSPSQTEGKYLCCHSQKSSCRGPAASSHRLGILLDFKRPLNLNVFSDSNSKRELC